eukprot:CAMPEP_0182800528 /NCGR_PEP_ID=MMETSP0006_2-20121128/2460_1 /TAXON_ID=97485 /ORGANISM="Prymnesium parvum, Strain Texoma1" /LENGTH=70 /DNA_ID=CAMNT_0024925775 /DNA_START=212 /DNA_END=425 /DNA_ORIENTATION=+
MATIALHDFVATRFEHRGKVTDAPGLTRFLEAAARSRRDVRAGGMIKPVWPRGRIADGGSHATCGMGLCV